MAGQLKLIPSLMCMYSCTRATCALHDVGGLRTQQMLSEGDEVQYGLLASPDAAVQSCMLGGVLASQRLRVFSAAIVQQRMGHGLLQHAKGPPQSRDELQEPKTHAKTASKKPVSQATAMGPTVQRKQIMSAASAAAKPLPVSVPQPKDVLARQQGYEARPGSPEVCKAAAALTAEGKERARRSMSILKKTKSKLGVTLQNAQVWRYACCRKGDPKSGLHYVTPNCCDVLSNFRTQA